MNPSHFLTLNRNPDLTLNPNNLTARAAGLELRLTLRSAILVLIVLLFTASAHAQWLTQPLPLKTGWNAVYLHVDATHDTLDNLVGNDPSIPIEEIWMWTPNPTAAQFVTSPQTPSQPTYWLNWVRTGSPSASLTRLSGNVACLIRASQDYTWSLKGKPVVPGYQWSGSGLNFIGFPTVAGASAPSFDTFFTPVPELKVAAEVFAYNGGPIENNPAQVFDFTARKVNRGEAFWIRSPEFNRYFGPFEVVVSSSGGVRFGDSVGQTSVRIKNTTQQDITITLSGINSEAAPTGQAPVQGPVPVLVRGDINTTTLTYSHAALASGPLQWTLKRSGEPGSVLEIVVGVDRQQLTGSPGQLYASVLRFTDSLNYSQIDVPVSAEAGSSAGLWVGGATVSSVNHYLNKYAAATNDTDLTALLARLGLGEGVNGFHYEIDPATQRVLVFGGPQNKTGSYLLDGPPRLDAGTVARPFPLRLIVHNDGSTARLLQKVYYGVGLATNPVVATRQALLLTSQLDSARRISSVHLPTSQANVPWDFTGNMRQGAALTTTITLGADNQASNPFLHTYHPDHDNLDASFRSAVPRGTESYEVRRQITLTFTPPASDFDSLTRGGSSLNGDYQELVSFVGKPGAQRDFTVRGSFTLNRISDIGTLTR